MHVCLPEEMAIRPWDYPEEEWTEWGDIPSRVDQPTSKRNLKAFGTNIYGDYDTFRMMLMTGRSLACHWWGCCQIVFASIMYLFCIRIRTRVYVFAFQ